MTVVRAAWLLAGTVLAVGAAASLGAWTPTAPSTTTQSALQDELGLELPVVRELSYVVNARVRPLLLFWIGRDDIGDAWVTWRAGSDGRHVLELLIGSDPARAPRDINRWGFIVEAWNSERADVLGLMTESDEQSIEEAEARIGTPGTGTKTYKAARSTIVGTRATGGTMTVFAPDHLTYNELDSLLARIPNEPPESNSVEVPAGTSRGFLTALETLLRTSIASCMVKGAGARTVPVVPYVYKQKFYDLALTSCDYEPELESGSRTFTGVVDGRFRVTNRSTGERTAFRVAYGTTGPLCALPVKASFRPRWWMELELELDQSTLPEAGPRQLPGRGAGQ